jgi:hypothetical protein
LKGRKVPCWQKLDLEADRELGANLVEDLLDRTRILDQSRDRAQQKILHTEKLIGSAGWA